MKDDQLTKKDLDNLKNELLDKLVDKDVHKKDLDNLKTDIAKLDIKEELNKVKKTLEIVAAQVTKNSLDIMDLKKETGEVHKKLDVILQSVDGLARLITNGQVEKAASEATFQRHEQWLEDHENRIGRIERKSA